MNICSVETSSDALNGSFALRIVITAAGCERGEEVPLTGDGINKIVNVELRGGLIRWLEARRDK